MITLTGKMSTFGGPDDTGMTPVEGLALIEPADLTEWWFDRVFEPPSICWKLFGLGRNLNPGAFYIAMRWDQVCPGVARDIIRRSLIRVSANGKCTFAQPVDYGPGDGKPVDGHATPDTGRIADLAPALADYLLLKTDDQVTCELILCKRGAE